ncbi:MAG: hypothetical protein ACON5A_05025 [Candidatus Comchoanobacterales bacterium]
MITNRIEVLRMRDSDKIQRLELIQSLFHPGYIVRKKLYQEDIKTAFLKRPKMDDAATFFDKIMALKDADLYSLINGEHAFATNTRYHPIYYLLALNSELFIQWMLLGDNGKLLSEMIRNVHQNEMPESRSSILFIAAMYLTNEQFCLFKKTITLPGIDPWALAPKEDIFGFGIDNYLEVANKRRLWQQKKLMENQGETQLLKDRNALKSHLKHGFYHNKKVVLPLEFQAYSDDRTKQNFLDLFCRYPYVFFKQINIQKTPMIQCYYNDINSQLNLWLTEEVSPDTWQNQDIQTHMMLFLMCARVHEWQEGLSQQFIAFVSQDHGQNELMIHLSSILLLNIQHEKQELFQHLMASGYFQWFADDQEVALNRTDIVVKQLLFKGSPCVLDWLLLSVDKPKNFESYMKDYLNDLFDDVIRGVVDEDCEFMFSQQLHHIGLHLRSLISNKKTDLARQWIALFDMQSILDLHQHYLNNPSHHLLNYHTQQETSFFLCIVQVLSELGYIATLKQIYIDTIKHYSKVKSDDSLKSSYHFYFSCLEKALAQQFEEDSLHEVLGCFLSYDLMDEVITIFPERNYVLAILKLSKSYPKLLYTMDYSSKDLKKILFHAGHPMLPSLLHYLAFLGPASNDTFNDLLAGIRGPHVSMPYWMKEFIEGFSVFYQKDGACRMRFHHAFEFIYDIFESLNLFGKLNKQDIFSACIDYAGNRNWLDYSNKVLKRSSKKYLDAVAGCKMLTCLLMHGNPKKCMYTTPILFNTLSTTMRHQLKQQIQTTVLQLMKTFLTHKKSKSQPKISLLAAFDSVFCDKVQLLHHEKPTKSLITISSLKLRAMKQFKEHFLMYLRSSLHLCTVINDDTANLKDDQVLTNVSGCISSMNELNSKLMSDDDTTKVGPFTFKHKSTISLMCNLAQSITAGIQALSHSIEKEKAKTILSYLESISDGQIDMLTLYTSIAVTMRYQQLIGYVVPDDPLANQKNINTFIQTLSLALARRLFYYMGKHEGHLKDGGHAKWYSAPKKWFYSKVDGSMTHNHPFSTVLQEALNHPCPDEDNETINIKGLTIKISDLLNFLPMGFEADIIEKKVSSKRQNDLKTFKSNFSDVFFFSSIGKKEYDEKRLDNQNYQVKVDIIPRQTVREMMKTSESFFRASEQQLKGVSRFLDGFYASGLSGAH